MRSCPTIENTSFWLRRRSPPAPATPLQSDVIICVHSGWKVTARSELTNISGARRWLNEFALHLPADRCRIRGGGPQGLLSTSHSLELMLRRHWDGTTVPLLVACVLLCKQAEPRSSRSDMDDVDVARVPTPSHKSSPVTEERNNEPDPEILTDARMWEQHFRCETAKNESRYYTVFHLYCLLSINDFIVFYWKKFLNPWNGANIVNRMLISQCLRMIKQNSWIHSKCSKFHLSPFSFAQIPCVLK